MAAEQQDHVVIGKCRQCLLDRIGVGRLGIVDVAHAVNLATRLHAVLERLERGKTAADTIGHRHRPPSSRGGAQGIDNIVMARDLELGCSDERGLDALQAHNHLAIAHKGGILALRLVKGNLADATTRRVDVLIELVNAGVFDVDNRQIVIDHIVKQFDLGKRVVLMALMPAKWSGVMLSSTATRGWSSVVVAI